MREPVVITDPLGNPVYIDAGFCSSGVQDLAEPEIFDDYTTVIRKPALLIETDPGTGERYYFRSIGWHSTMLVIVKNQNATWVAYKCIRNPSSAYLFELMKSGRQLI